MKIRIGLYVEKELYELAKAKLKVAPYSISVSGWINNKLREFVNKKK